MSQTPEVQKQPLDASHLARPLRSRLGAPQQPQQQLDPRLHRREIAGRNESVRARPSPRRCRRGSGSPAGPGSRAARPRCSSAAASSRWIEPLPVAATTSPSTPAATSARTARPSTPAALVTISTHGQGDPVGGSSSRPRAVSAATAGLAASRPGLDPAERPGVARRERIEPRRMDLAHVARPNAACRRRRRRRRARPASAATAIASARLLRPVGLARGRRPHRPGQHHRLGRRPDTVQEVRRLLERVGAMRDDDAGHLGPRHMVGHPLREPLPGGEVHVLAVELRDLLGLDAHAGRRRHRGDQRVDADGAGGVADVVVGRRGGAGDRAAGAEDDDGGSRRALHFCRTG